MNEDGFPAAGRFHFLLSSETSPPFAGNSLLVIPEPFKAQAAHFPTYRDGKTGMQRATLGKSGSEAALQLQGRIARAFSSNGLVNTMDMTAAIQCILTAAQLLGSQVYYKVSNDDAWACWCIILRKRASIDKIDYHMFPRKYLLRSSGKLGEVLK